MPYFQQKRGTRAQLDANATADALKLGQVYLITDEDRIAMGTGASTYVAYAKQSEAGGGGGGAPTWLETEIDLGSVPRHGGRFTISGAGMVAGKPVIVIQAAGPYTGKGTLADEAEMDGVDVSARVTAANTITAHWRSARAVLGNFKFNYLVGA